MYMTFVEICNNVMIMYIYIIHVHVHFVHVATCTFKIFAQWPLDKAVSPKDETSRNTL